MVHNRSSSYIPDADMKRFKPLPLFLALLVGACLAMTVGKLQSMAEQTPVQLKQDEQHVLAVFAHPDDETWISGTLALLANRGITVTPIYATSGEAGQDFSGANLTGPALADIREAEAIKASQALGLSAPVFLRYPDGDVEGHRTQIREQLVRIINATDPIGVVTFDPGGVTGHPDHISIGEIASGLSEREAVHFVVSQTRAQQLSQYAANHGIPFKVSNPVADAEITHRIDVGNYQDGRINAQAAHPSQFPPIMIQAFADFVRNVPTEELVIPAESGALEEFLEKLGAV